MKEKLKVGMFSAGMSSFLACYYGDVDKLYYIHIDDQHEDTLRFVKDCEQIIGKEIEILQSNYKSVDNVIQATNYIRGSRFANCTKFLKQRVRKEYEYKHRNYDIEYVMGFDNNEIDRAYNIKNANEKYNYSFPLIHKSLSKHDVHAICKNKFNLKRPYMYELGYQNNNCIGCLKGGMGYWNKIRKDFPEIFALRAKREREIGTTILKDKNGYIFLDELDPLRGVEDKIIMQECSILCERNPNL